MNYDNQLRATMASNLLMWLAIGFGCLPWWLDALALGSIAEHPIDWIVAAALTAALISVSLILSGAVTRFAEAIEKRYWLTAGLTVILGLVLVMIEAGMTHQGLAWIDARKDLAPDWALWVVSFGLSAFNVFSLYTYSRDLKKQQKPETSAGKLLALRRWQKVA
jgi:uncharacterized membrane protein